MSGFNHLDNVFDWTINFSNNMLMPIMLMTVVVGVALRFLSYWTLKREDWFAKAFQKRAHVYVENHTEMKHHRSFFVMTKYLLEKTYYELFTVRSIMKRRNPDYVMAVSDRVFLIQQGCARIVKDTQKQTKYFRYDIHRPKMIEVSKLIFQNNPCFNRVFGIIPINTVNDIVALLPGMVIIMGIFGTFVGIMDALPKVSGMDIADPESSKKVMDAFLFTIAHSMKSSILGIFLSVSMTIINSIFNPGRIFMDIVERFENTLDVLWNSCNNNHLPNEISSFDEHRDPIEALAEDAVNKELETIPEYIDDRNVAQDIPPKFPQIPKAS
jgi:hypothetical protein